jgi:hypothetical protein
VPEVAVQPIVGVLPDGAGVEDDHVGLVVGGVLGCAPVAGVLQEARQPLRIVHVHLAAVGTNGVRPLPHLGFHRHDAFRVIAGRALEETESVRDLGGPPH